MKHRHKLVLASTGVFFTAWLVATAFAQARPDQDIDIVRGQGDLKATVTQARELLGELAAKNWDAKKVDHSLLRAPDQSFSPDESQRAPKWPTYTFQKGFEAYYPEVAFFTDLYVRKGLKVVKGSEGNATAEGFYVVGWRDGRVTLVPLPDVRLLKVNSEESIVVFPGMKAYNAELPLMFKKEAMKGIPSELNLNKLGLDR